MAGTLDVTEISADFSIGDLLEAQRMCPGLDAIAISRDGQSRLYGELAEQQVEETTLVSAVRRAREEGSKVAYTGLKLEVV